MPRYVDTVLKQSPFGQFPKQHYDDDSSPSQENILYLYRCRDDREENKAYYHWDNIDDINYQILQDVNASLGSRHR